MFHLFQRFQIPSKVVYHQRLLQLGRREIIYSAYSSSCRLPKLQLLRQAPASIIKAQDFHHSGCSWKKKKLPEPELNNLSLARCNILSLKDSPKPALYLGFAGLIPFVSMPLIMAIQQVSYSELVFAQIAYGASILSFLGGIRWGFALPEGSPEKPDWFNLFLGIVPPLISWLALLLYSATEAGFMIIVGLGIALHNDLAFFPTYPSWFKGLRIILTIVAAGSLLATIFIMNFFPEKHLSDTIRGTNSKLK
nr:transmembrane protein 69 [Pogona vitticeps]